MRIIGGEARGRRLLTPRDDTIRPALDRIRESVFSVVEESIQNQTVLDLFAGVGSIGLEAVSRGARRAVFVDQSRGSLEILSENIRNLGFSSRCKVIRGDALTLPAAPSADLHACSLIFMDPPFSMFATDRLRDDVIRRVRELLNANVLTTPGWLILRHPSSWSGEVPIEPQRRQTYGESTVLFYASE